LDELNEAKDIESKKKKYMYRFLWDKEVVHNSNLSCLHISFISWGLKEEECEEISED